MASHSSRAELITVSQFGYLTIMSSEGKARGTGDYRVTWATCLATQVCLTEGFPSDVIRTFIPNACMIRITVAKVGSPLFDSAL